MTGKNKKVEQAVASTDGAETGPSTATTLCVLQLTGRDGEPRIKSLKNQSQTKPKSSKIFLEI